MVKKQQKKQLCKCSRYFCTFFCHCFVRLQYETSRDFLITRFMEEMSHVFLFTFFSLLLFFILVAVGISHFLTTATKFSCSSSNKKCLHHFFCLPLALFLIELCWPVSPLFLLLRLSLSLFSKFVEMTI